MRKRRIIDKITRRVRCPGIFCHSADVQVIGKTLFGTKYQCRRCGRIFKA